MTLEELILRIRTQGGANSKNQIKSLRQGIRDYAREVRRSKNDTAAMIASVGALGIGMQNAGRRMTDFFTRNIIKMGIEIVKTAASFESQMVRVKTLSQATGEEFVQLKDKAMEMGRTTKFTATEVGKAMEYMALAGWDTSQMLAGISPLLDLAAASGEDLAFVSDIVTDAITALGLKAEDTRMFVDLLAHSARSSNTNILKMGETFKYVTPIARAAGYSANDLMLAIAMLANNGIKASRAGTTLRGAIARLAAPTEKGAMWMDKLGIKVADAKGKLLPFQQVLRNVRKGFKNLSQEQKIQAAHAIFGRTAMSGMLSIVNTSDKAFEKLVKTTNDFNGAASEMSKEQLNTLTGQWAIFKSILESVAIDLGTMVLPYFRKLVDFLQKIAYAFLNSNPTVKLLAVAFAALLAAIGPVVFIGGTLVTVAAAIAGAIALLGAPIFLVIAALAPLAVVFGAVGVAILAVLHKTGLLQKGFNFLKSVIQSIVAFFKGDTKSAFDILKKQIGMSDEGANKFIETLRGVKRAASVLKGVFESVKNVLHAIFSGDDAELMVTLQKEFGLSGEEAMKFKDTINELKDKLKEMLTNMKGEALENLMNFGKVIKDLALKIYENRDKIIDFIGTLAKIATTLAKVVTNIQKGAALIRKIFEKLYDVLVGHSIIPDLINGIIKWFNKLPSKLKSLATNAKNAVINAFNSMKSKISSVASNIYSTISSKFNSARSIAVSRFKSLASGVVSAVRSLPGKIGSFFGQMASKISSAAGRAGSAARSVGTSIKNGITSVAKSAYQWGANIVSSVANGIRNAAGQVASAASYVASKIKGFLGFGSPTKEGPGATAHRWIPNLIKMLSHDLEAGVSRIRDASAKVASNLSFTPQTTPLSNVSTDNSVKQVSITINGANMNADEIGNALVEKLQLYGIQVNKR